MSVPRERMSGGGGPNPEFHLQDFSGGVHVFGAREVLTDQEMWWCENVIPLADGNLANLPPVSTALGTFTDTGTPSYAMTFNVNATPFAFVAFGATTGTGYIVNLLTGVATKIINSGLTTVAAAQYSNTGLLIIDPSGYWDWNITTPSTLTTWANAVAAVTLLTTGIVAPKATGGGNSLTRLNPTGTGAVVVINYQAQSVSINAAGINYKVGDVLTLTDNNPTTPTSLIVTSIGGGGTITGISFVSLGSYPGPSSGSAATGPSGTVVSGGSGTGATFLVVIIAFSVTVTAPGHGYTNGGTFVDDALGPTAVAQAQLSTGPASGQAIAVYAGHVWVASGRTILVSDINSFSFFGGTGTSFTINDSYLYNNITVLESTNNYLYIFGVTSIDALSNVTVSATTGILSFTRVNVVQGIGTNSPASVFTYYRSVAFFDPSGFYLLNGATPEKISEKISDLVTGVQFLGSTNNPVYGCPVWVHGELCAAFSFVIADTFSGRSVASRNFIALFFRRRWWIMTLNTGAAVGSACPPMVGVVSNTGKWTMFQIGNTSGTNQQTFQALIGAGLAPWIVRTRLWDGGAILREKQAVNAALAAVMLATGTSGVTFKVDTELKDGVTATAFPLSDNNQTYHLMVEEAQGGGGQYIGLTLNGDGTDTAQARLVALKGVTERSMME